jgi:hypothetical protein
MRPFMEVGKLLLTTPQISVKVSYNKLNASQASLDRRLSLISPPSSSMNFRALIIWCLAWVCLVVHVQIFCTKQKV